MKARRTATQTHLIIPYTAFMMYYVSNHSFVHTPHEFPTPTSPKRTNRYRTFGGEAAAHAVALRVLCERFQASARFIRSAALACDAVVRAPPSICATSRVRSAGASCST